MHKTLFPEWLLARFIGRERAAAVLGDLVEIAGVRGRLWFWMNYLRTLLSLGGRSGASAFVLAFLCLRFMFTTGIRWLMNHWHPTLQDPGLFGPTNHHVRIVTWNLSMLTAQFLIFAFPFVLVRFGVRHRLTQLAGALFLVLLPVYTLRPWFMDLSGVVTLALIAAALIAPLWRRPLAILAVTMIPAVAIKVICFSVALPLRSKIAVPASWVVVEDALSFAVASIVCLQMARLLLRRRPTGNDHEVAPL